MFYQLPADLSTADSLSVDRVSCSFGPQRVTETCSGTVEHCEAVVPGTQAPLTLYMLRGPADPDAVQFWGLNGDTCFVYGKVPAGNYGFADARRAVATEAVLRGLAA